MKRLCLILLAALINLLLSGCESKEGGPMMETPAIPVKAVKPTVKDITVFLEAIGTFEPSVFMEIRPQIDGTLEEILTSEGTWVEKGTPLFKIDEKPYRIKVQEAEAQLSIDQAHLKEAEKKLARIKPLAQKDLVSQVEWEEREAEVEKSRGIVALDEARLNSAKLELEHCTIFSPSAGRVGKLDAHPGFLVARGQIAPIATISKMDPLLVEFALTEKEFPKIPKESVRIELTSLCAAGECKEGTITFMDNHFDSATGLILLRGMVKNPDYSLRPGQSVHVRVPTSVSKNAVLIPQKAIRYNQQGPYVYIVQPDQTILQRQLILGEEEGTDQVVKEGLDPSEQLIIDGHLRLSPGVKVEVKQ